LEIVEAHPTFAAIRAGREVTDEQLVDLERTLHRELGEESDLHLSSNLIRIAYGLKTESFLGFLRHVLTLDAIPDYSQIVQRAFEQHIATHRYNADKIRFLRAVQELFLTQRTLAEADLYEPPLTVFGRNAVDRFFSSAEVREILDLTDRLAA
jgi:type I restriction enzyme R subunit